MLNLLTILLRENSMICRSRRCAVHRQKIYVIHIGQGLVMVEKKGGATVGRKNITVPPAAALRQQGVRGQAGGAQQAAGSR